MNQNSTTVKNKFLLNSLSVFIISLTTFTLQISANAKDLQGPEKIISQIQASLKTKQTDTNPTIENRLQLAKDMEKYDKNLKSMSEEEAARQWLALATRFLKLSPVNPALLPTEDLDKLRYLVRTSSLKYLFEIIPGPFSWSHLAKLANEKSAKKENNPDGMQSIVMFCNLLNTDTKKVLKGLDHFESMALKESPYQINRTKSWFKWVREEVKLFDKAKNTGNVISEFKKLLDFYQNRLNENIIINVPDLLSHIDVKQATELLKQGLSIPTVSLVIPTGDKTKKLAENLVLQNKDSLKRPQWGLIHSIDTVHLFEIQYEKFYSSKKDLNKDFSQMVQSNSDDFPFEEQTDLKQQAVAFYLLGLLAQNKTEKANTFAKALSETELSARKMKDALETTGRTDLFPRYFDFIENLLKNNPELSFWNQYVKFASIVHQEERMTKTLITMTSSSSLDFLKKQKIKKKLIKAYLAQDRVEEGLSVIREIIATKTDSQKKKTRYKFADIQGDMGLKLAELGRILNRPELVKEGLEAAKAAFHAANSFTDINKGYISSYQVAKISDILIESGQFQEAEELILKAVLEQTNHSNMNSESPVELLQYSLSEYFYQLATIYSKAGKHKDVLTLLVQSPWWGHKDLAGLTNNDIFIITAKALHATGKNKTAVAILKSHLIKNSNDDEAYKLLVKLSGAELIPWLDKLYQTDRFEERPLIWKAYILLQDNKLDEAETVVRQAMKVDPTDGEQKAGQRIYSYTLLAEILEKKGKTKDSKFFHDVVKSVQIAEQGDKFTKIGLVKRSIGYYQKAMALFADAYCIQWRLAERLYATGNLEESKKHYKIAFERMPEQFGRVASFCFGCEGAFDKLQSRSVAEEVFSHLVETTPDRPQVYFLFGLLRKSQDRIPEAYDFFKKAVELDSDYLDVWKEIFEISSIMYLNQAERDSIVIKMLNLDSQQKHFSSELSKVTDWKNLWLTLEQNQQYSMKQAKRLFLLPASEAQLNKEQKEENKKNNPQYYYQKLYRESVEENTLKPAFVLSNHGFIRSIDYFISLEKNKDL